MIAKIKNLQDTLLSKNSTILLTFGFTDLFCLMFLLIGFVADEDAVMLIVLSCMVSGSVIAGIIMSNVSAVWGKDGKETMASKYRYFPVSKMAVRKAQYALALKITGMQVLFCFVPVLLTAFYFNLENVLIALASTAVSMMGTSVMIIEINLFSFGRK